MLCQLTNRASMHAAQNPLHCSQAAPLVASPHMTHEPGASAAATRRLWPVATKGSTCAGTGAAAKVPKRCCNMDADAAADHPDTLLTACGRTLMRTRALRRCTRRSSWASTSSTPRRSTATPAPRRCAPAASLFRLVAGAALPYIESHSTCIMIHEQGQDALDIDAHLRSPA